MLTLLTSAVYLIKFVSIAIASGSRGREGKREE
jgi:hypothetical protein